MTLREAAARDGSRRGRSGAGPAGSHPQYDGEWTPVVVAHARIVARLRERATLKEIRKAGESGRLAFGYIEDLFPPASGGYTLEEAAEDTGLEPALIERIWSHVGFNLHSLEHISEEDLRLLRYIAAVLAAGPARRLPPAGAGVRPGGRAGGGCRGAAVPPPRPRAADARRRGGLEIAEEMESLARELLPLASPSWTTLHQRFLAHFLEQDVIGHMEADLEEGGTRPGPPAGGVAFADLAGYTRC